MQDAMNRILIISLIALAACSCQGTWLMYDTQQKDKLYFTVNGEGNVASFALIAADELQVKADVNILGTPKPHDRTFHLEFSDAAQGETYSVGNEQIEVLTAHAGSDFTTEDLILKAGEVKTAVTFSIRRNPEMLGKYLKIHARIVGDEEFLPMDSDSTNMKRIITPEYVLYITDGEPSCPEWWRTSAGNVDYQWGAYYGKYLPAKYRKMLEYYHAIADKNAPLYEEMVAKYGENIDKEGLQRNFMSMQEQSVWATYVLIPLHAYYMEYYRLHPENAENFGPTGDLTTFTWGDPMRLLR